MNRTPEPMSRRPELPFHWTLVLLLALSVVLAACGASGAPSNAPAAEADQERPIKIALMAPLTGGAAAVGEPQLNFVRLAVEQFNAEHGTNIELVEGDTELDPAKATTLAQRLLADEAIYAVIGPAGSQEVAAVAPLLAAADLALVSPSATKPDLTEQGLPNVFRVVPRDDVQSATVAQFLLQRLAATRVWLIDDQSSYGVGLVDAIEAQLRAAGVAVVRESVGQDETDFSALVTRMRADQPDAVFLGTQVASQGALLARQMQEQRVQALLLGGDGLMTEDFIANAGGATEGAYVSFFAPDVTNLPSAQPVIEAYTSRHGAVGPFGPPAYTAAMVVLEAILRASAEGPLTRAAVRDAIAQTNQAESLLGIPIAFDTKGDIQNASFFLYQVQGGAFVPAR
ncbi:MAG: ABC transporter substrate-binding protein [Chloroflexi bacterium OHK40]